MSDADSIELPEWARVSEKRRAHIARVVHLIGRWSDELGLDAAEASAWRDAARWHDALRDAPEPELRALISDTGLGASLLHGPAAALRLSQDGEKRVHVLEAVRWHTVGWSRWARTGRALYMADYLEPGRSFSTMEREFLVSIVPYRFEAAFRQVVKHRLEWSLREGNALFPETVELWNSLR